MLFVVSVESTERKHLMCDFVLYYYNHVEAIYI